MIVRQLIFLLLFVSVRVLELLQQGLADIVAVLDVAQRPPGFDLLNYVSHETGQDGENRERHSLVRGPVQVAADGRESTVDVDGDVCLTRPGDKRPVDRSDLFD